MRLARAAEEGLVKVRSTPLLLDRAEPRAPLLGRQRQPERVCRPLELLQRALGCVDAIAQLAERAADQGGHLVLPLDEPRVCLLPQGLLHRVRRAHLPRRPRGHQALRRPRRRGRRRGGSLRHRYWRRRRRWWRRWWRRWQSSGPSLPEDGRGRRGGGVDGGVGGGVPVGAQGSGREQGAERRHPEAKGDLVVEGDVERLAPAAGLDASACRAHASTDLVLRWRRGRGRRAAAALVEAQRQGEVVATRRREAAAVAFEDFTLSPNEQA
mmetsp:Transcript_44035/g.139536  ORF Transcript_44035/g.139536 Transcript_44035/m.139536 type:complete len:268 (-) Transcript_44035:245-1048(-)